MDKSKRNRKISKFKMGIFLLIIIIGVSALSYPFLTQYYSYRKSQAVIGEYVKNTSDKNQEDINKKIKSAQAYNEALFRGENSKKIEDPFEKSVKDIDDYASMIKIGDEIGVISIPVISQEIPVYAGASENNLEKGAAHLKGTSLPVGGNNTHSVITAHRGLPESRLFTDLDKLKKNDFFYYKIFDKVLAYQIDDIKTVNPEEIDFKIEAGHDYMTLLTCTPYMVNTQRLLVRGHRVEFEQYLMDRQIKDSNTDNKYRYLFYISLTLLLLLVIIISIRYYFFIRERNQEIKKEYELYLEKMTKTGKGVDNGE